jgi:hypothetical protein
MMQLAYLLPHLDSEIERLQKARDLLALISSSRLSPANVFESPISSKMPAQPPSSIDVHQESNAQVGEPVVSLSSPSAPSLVAINSAADLNPRPIQRRRRRSDLHSREPKLVRRKRPVVEDTALTGSVPSGPVVISAEQVRKSQELKAAEALRVAEVKKAGSDLSSSIGWRNRATDARSVDALLQKLINLGSDDPDQATAGQIS